MLQRYEYFPAVSQSRTTTIDMGAIKRTNYSNVQSVRRLATLFNAVATKNHCFSGPGRAIGLRFLSVCESKQLLLNEMTVDLDFWQASVSRHYLSQVRLPNS